jgi:hypothetical protein
MLNLLYKASHKLAGALTWAADKIDPMPKPKVYQREDAVHFDTRCKHTPDTRHVPRDWGNGTPTCRWCHQFLWGITNIEEEDYIDDLITTPKKGALSA